MYHFCTYFDHNYLPLGLSLYYSLQKNCGPFKLWVLCLSDTCYDVLSQLNIPNITLIPLEELERLDKPLQEVKQNRSLIEYYFTCTPCLPLFILNNYPEVDLITYVDADLFFFSNVQPIYKEIGDHSIAIIEHRFSPDRLHLVVFGIYNVGWLSFRQDKYGLECLEWWKEKCLEWCYDRPDNDNKRFADQKYLDEWPERFTNLVVIKNKGANIGHWNANNYQIYVNQNKIWIDDEPLIFFHFHAFKFLKQQFELYCLNPQNTVKKFSDSIIWNEIYSSYLRNLREILDEIRPLLPDISLEKNIRVKSIETSANI